MKTRFTCLFLLPALLFSCNTIDKYEWRPTESSPLLYPMNIHSGYLFMEDGKSIYIPCSGVSHTGWGYGGSMHVTGEDFKAVPVRLEVTWASFLENKFYTGSWDLPVDTIKALFKKGIIDWHTKQQSNYSSVVVGLAPGGVAVVWLYGNHQQVEIARLQAKETQVPMAEYVPSNSTITQQEYFDVRSSVPEAYENIAKHGIQYGRWDLFRKKYLWRPEIEIPHHSMHMVMMEMLNGEQQTLFDVTMKENAFLPRAIPRYFTFSFLNAQQVETDMEFRYLDEEEMLGIFQQLDTARPIRVILRMDENHNSRSLVVKQGEKEFPLTKVNMDDVWNPSEVRTDSPRTDE